MSAPASDPPNSNPPPNDPPKEEDNAAGAAEASTSTTTATGNDGDVQMKDEEKKEEEVVVDRYEDIPEHVMSVSLGGLCYLRVLEGNEMAYVSLVPIIFFSFLVVFLNARIAPLNQNRQTISHPTPLSLFGSTNHHHLPPHLNPFLWYQLSIPTPHHPNRSKPQ